MKYLYRHFAQQREWRDRWLLLPLLITAVLYLLVSLVCAVKFDVVMTLRGTMIDVTVLTVLAIVFFVSARTFSLFVLTQTSIVSLLLIGNALKISFNGGPIMPDDVGYTYALLLILDNAWRALAVTALVLPVVFWIANLRWRWTTLFLPAGGLAAIGLPILLMPAAITNVLDEWLGNSVWNQRENYLNRGSGLHLLQETARLLAERPEPPTTDEVVVAMQNLPAEWIPVIERQPGKLRSVHLILLESFWDVAQLQNAGFSRDPFDERFRRLWSAAGNSTALVPVFGGYTANPGFEVLCGFPIARDGVKFERRLSKSVPCLPAVLGQAGYRSVASHPNVPVFWNRRNTYSRIGFEVHHSLQDFELDDMNDEFLSDASLYRQVSLKNRHEQSRPQFNYVLTYFGHWWYPLNENRPTVVSARSDVDDVEKHANTVYYKSKELVDYIATVLADDPEALIVALGDHLPTLGANFAGYTESGVWGSTFDEFDAPMFRRFVTTPLLVIDGSNGPLRVGAVPAYQLPAKILQLLGLDQPAIWDFARQPEGLKVRPLPWVTLALTESDETLACRPGEAEPVCQAASQWLERTNVLDSDIFTGRGEALRYLPMPNTWLSSDTR